MEGSPHDMAKYRKAFEDFVRTPDTWPEAEEIRRNWADIHEAREAALPLLPLIANRDASTITTRCDLCERG
jgi:hypothetical protein